MLDDDTAILTDATPQAFAGGHPRGARRSGARGARSARARSELAETKYSYEAYLEQHAAAPARALLGDGRRRLARVVKDVA